MNLLVSQRLYFFLWFFIWGMAAVNTQADERTSQDSVPHQRQSIDYHLRHATAALHYFSGIWDCETQYSSRTQTKKTPRKIWDLRYDEANFLLTSIVYETRAESSVLTEMKKTYWIYDSINQRFFYFGFAANGTVFSLSSTGWDQSKWVWVGDSIQDEKKTIIRYILENKKPNEMALSYEAMINGKWTLQSEERCLRKQIP